MASTTISRATVTDDDGSGTTGTVLNSAWFGTAIYDKVDALFSASQQIEVSSSGSVVDHTVYNTSNTASSDGRRRIIVGGSSAGDAYEQFIVNGVTTWAVGVDNSDGDYFKIAASATLGTSDAITVTDQRSVVLGSAALSTSATQGFLYVASCAGTPTGVAATFTGRVALTVDTTNSKLYAYIGGVWKGVTVA